MNGYDYFQKYYTKRIYPLLFNSMMAVALLFPIAGLISSIYKEQEASAWAFLIFFFVALLFFCLPYFFLFYILPRKARIEKRKVAASLGLENTRGDWGLTLEKDFEIEREEKIKYFPAVWFVPSIRKVPQVIAGYRASLMLTKQRLIIPGPKGLSLFFTKKDADSIIFDSIEKIKYPSGPTTVVDGLCVWYYIPNEISGRMRLFPTKNVRERNKEGYITDHCWIFPQNIEEFIVAIETATKVNQ